MKNLLTSEPRAASRPGRMSLPLLLLAAMASPVGAQAPERSNQIESVHTGEAVVSVVEVAAGLDTPWGMTFLPDGRMLVTERPGNLVIVAADGAVSSPLAGTPTVYAQGQGGLMDVALHPDFAQNRMVYLTFAEPGPDGSAAVSYTHLTLPTIYSV